MTRELVRAGAFLAILGILTAILAVLIGVDGWRTESDRRRRQMNGELVKALALSDLSIWTEARYTRHPSQADVFTPFQSVPSALEHYPSGSWVAPRPGPWAGEAEAGPPLAGGGEAP